MTVPTELKQRAHRDPQSLSKKEWALIHKDTFDIPKKNFNDEQPKQKRKEWWSE